MSELVCMLDGRKRMKKAELGGRKEGRCGAGEGYEWPENVRLEW